MKHSVFKLLLRDEIVVNGGDIPMCARYRLRHKADRSKGYLVWPATLGFLEHCLGCHVAAIEQTVSLVDDEKA